MKTLEALLEDPVRRRLAERVYRALGLRAEPLGRGVWRVRGGEEMHWVHLRDRAVAPCDCGDAVWRERICKHVIAARLAAGEPVRAVLREALLVERSRPTAGAGRGLGNPEPGQP